MMDELKDLFKFQINRNIRNLYKDFLCLTEDLKTNHRISNDDYQYIRKKVLDKGNDCIRELEEFVDKFDIVKFNHKD